MDGIIVINKPYGTGSHRVVQAIRRLFPGVKAGHSGTLDPIATGVLPVCLGKATRLVEYIVEQPKTYRAAVSLGKSTDTDDSAGRITAQHEVPEVDRARIEQILSGFKGPIEQLPPVYSAVKYQGKPLYYWARRGKEVPRKVRRADIYMIELLEYDHDREPQIIFDVQCSKGTYIRSLAADIGRALDCGDHLFSLTRLAVGPYDLKGASTLDEVARLAESGQQKELIRPMDSALTFFPALELEDFHIQALKDGQMVMIEHVPKFGTSGGGQRFRIYDRHGNFKAVARFEPTGDRARLKTIKFLAS